ncbi:MAG TPA: 50S ribosomal protein L15 [Planctomycetaceae bacterium]|nr:50S ribosomal protein L15 [Planctomycetaceae bacterium]HQZ64634.1 50S ribosomal protein L15 [Planctomycetaceae bacterium]
MILNDVHVGIEPRKQRKRIGRGPGSGHGKTSGRGHKGFFSRSGSSRRRGFHGGQMPLFRRVAKRGFNNNFFASSVAVVNVGELNDSFEAGAEITPELLLAKGLIRSKFDELKVLGDGELSKKFRISAHRFSSSAEQKISAAGGSFERIQTGAL